jgi:hypothetical protein
VHEVNKKFITVDHNFLEEHKLLSIIMMEMIITQDKIAHTRFVHKLTTAAYGDLTAESLKGLETLLLFHQYRNYRELSILQGMQHIAVQMDVIFDHEAAYKFLSTYLLEQGDIEPPVSLSVSDVVELREEASFVSPVSYSPFDSVILTNEILSSVLFTDMSIVDVAVVSKNTDPVLSKPRGQLRAVK